MSKRIPPLYPWPLARLLNRIEREWAAGREIYGLSARRFYRPAAERDLGCTLGGQRVATPVGPAAGPHTQLAQNIVLGWLAGARTFELKTVQVLDELDIDRPCIDMENVGYNIEWSQELTLPQSLAEYTKAWYMLAILRRWGPLREVLGDAGGHVFEMSVGYDLAGVQSAAMDSFVRGMLDVGAGVDALRAEVPAAFAAQRDVTVPARMVQNVTLSTFHGCPPDEIEQIVKHMMTTYDLDVTVKLNPTLLGQDTVAEILHEQLGYRDIELDPAAFAADLQFDRALEMLDSLRDFAAARGREFGIKLTNTLVVRNTRGVMPGENMYLSGKPLHVMAMTLLDRLHRALPGRLRLAGQAGPIPVAFSAGIDKDNLTGAVALGLAPVTICSDLLKPGGYGRLAQGLRKLERELAASQSTSLVDWQARAVTAAEAAGHPDVVAHHLDRLGEPEGYARYALARTGKPLRQVDHELARFDCVACNNCVSVCPNNAFLAVPTGEVSQLAAKAQYLVLAELCNDCGNCTTFCPEVGAPHLIKPRVFLDEASWRARGGVDFLLAGDGTVTGGEADDAELTGTLLARAPWSLTD